MTSVMRGAPAPDLIAASLLTSPAGAELELVARDGQRLRLATDEATARALAVTLWQTLDKAG
jgi:hypothetical protein